MMILCYRAWSQCTWKESNGRGITVKRRGACPTNWIIGEYLYWPNKNVAKMAEAMEDPVIAEWFSYKLVEVKGTAGIYNTNLFTNCTTIGWHHIIVGNFCLQVTLHAFFFQLPWTNVTVCFWTSRQKMTPRGSKVPWGKDTESEPHPSG